MTLDPDWALVARYLRGDCTPEEAEVVERWRAASAENAATFELLREVWEQSAIEWPPTDEAKGWKELRGKIAVATRPVVVRPLNVLPGGRERGQRRFRAWLAAAAVLATLGGTLWAKATWRWEAARPRADQAAPEYATRRGQRAELMLVDGTRVWLNADSRLRVRPGYGTKARDVELDGEAYFQVEHDQARPFRVHTRGAVSEDLGTEFNVRAYASEASEEVVVALGRVAVRHTTKASQSVGESGLELGRGQMSRIDRTGRIALINGVDPAIAAGWRSGQLKFKDTPVADAVRELERWYDLDITLDDSLLASVPLTASLTERTADQALAVVAGVLNVTYRRDDRHVRLMPKPARH
jgi:ferric-dicitrate binding protein FerR (iron transport regulator)